MRTVRLAFMCACAVLAGCPLTMDDPFVEGPGDPAASPNASDSGAAAGDASSVGDGARADGADGAQEADTGPACGKPCGKECDRLCQTGEPCASEADCAGDAECEKDESDEKVCVED